MMLILIVHKPLLKFIIINIIAAITWPPPLISQLFHSGFLKAPLFYTAWLFFFAWISLFCTLSMHLKVNHKLD